MSVQPAPTNTGTPVYNPINYINPTATNGVTPEYLQQNYLQFPTAQGTEEFPNGLFSVGAIDFNSSNGNDRLITGLSKSSFTDILGNNAYTSYIEENSTAIGSYNGGLIIHSSNTIDLQGGNVLVNGTPITTGSAGNVNNNQNNTFLSPYSQTFQGQVLIDNTILSFPNNGYIGWNNGTSLLNFPTTIPNSSSASGLGLSWNTQSGTGEVDLICYGQGGQGGFAFYAITSTSISPTLIANLFPNGIDFKQNIISNNTFTGNNYFNTGFINLENITGTFPSTPLGYSQFVSFNGNPWFSPTNGGGIQLTTSTSLTTALLPYALLASPALTGTPTAPTATAGTNTTQIATTAFVSTSFAPKASPALTGTPTAPTATAGTNTTQIATTAFVQSAVGTSSQIIHYPSSSTTGTIGSSSTTWSIIISPQTTTAFTTPPWGKTFSYKIYTDINSSTYSLPNGSALSVQSLFSSMSGTGVYQPFTQSATNFWGYIFSQATTQVGAFKLDYINTTPNFGSNYINITGNSTNAGLSSVSLIMDIYPNP